MEATAEVARQLIAAIRGLPDSIGDRDMTPQQVLAIAASMRAAHLLGDLIACHERGATELEAAGLRSILEAMIRGRYALHSPDDDVARWPVSFDRRRLRFADEFGRDPAEVEISHPEQPGDEGLPDLRQMADRVDELSPPTSQGLGARHAYDILHGTMSDQHVHSGPGAISRYLERSQAVRFISRPKPLIDPGGMLTMAFAASGVLYEEVCASLGVAPA